MTSAQEYTDTRDLFQMAQSIPMLENGEDAQLGRAWRDHRDVKARNKLVESHLRFALSQIKHYKATGISKKDLAQIAFEGLLKAANKYDPDKKEGFEYRFATYAAQWIRASINELAIKQRSAVKMGTTGEQKAVFFNLGKAMQAIQQRHRVMDISQYTEEHWQDLTDEINNSERKKKVSVRDVKYIAGRLNAGDASLNAPVYQEGEGSEAMTFQDTLVSEDPSTEEAYEEFDEQQVRRELLVEAFGALNDREKDVVIRRRVAEEAETLEDLSNDYGVSRERVRQIEEKGLQKLRKAFRTHAANRFGSNHPDVVKLTAAIDNNLKFKI